MYSGAAGGLRSRCVRGGSRLYYRVPDKWQPVLFNERYQMAGLAKNVEADTVLVGTSMAANYRSSWIQETFGTSAVRLTIPDGYYSEVRPGDERPLSGPRSRSG